MRKNYISVGTFFGIELRINYSWFIIFILIAWIVITSYVPSYQQHMSTTFQVVTGLVVTVIFFLSVIAHEYAHSLVANHYGLDIKRITLFIFGGASELQRDPQTPKIEFLMAAAGPATSLGLAGIFGLLWNLAQAHHITIMEVIFGPSAVLNLIVGIFNLLPAFPMDGGRMLRSIIWGIRKDMLRATKNATDIGVVFAYILMALGLTEMLFGYVLSGVWLAIIGFFIAQSARYSYRQTMLQQILVKLHINDIIKVSFVTVPGQITVKDFLDIYVLRQQQQDFLVMSPQKEVIGILDYARIPQNITETELSEPVEVYMQPLDDNLRIKTDDTAFKAYMTLQSYNVNMAPVFRNNTLVGIITKRFFDDYMAIRKLQGKFA